MLLKVDFRQSSSPIISIIVDIKLLRILTRIWLGKGAGSSDFNGLIDHKRNEVFEFLLFITVVVFEHRSGYLRCFFLQELILVDPIALFELILDGFELFFDGCVFHGFGFVG